MSATKLIRSFRQSVVLKELDTKKPEILMEIKKLYLKSFTQFTELTVELASVGCISDSVMHHDHEPHNIQTAYPTLSRLCEFSYLHNIC